ncbi:GATA zinc finger domain-containing protein 14 isoform X2 [Teleopsis dalmanni]|uniref:GATA zinc finger domain-containing protein 14 isoform X2 n=1 Tax=Teleopsis dalmanni TaxID=139649 RepID=UPI0018CCFE6C|nr:GATA zinc finger domain-containing protein 14 isoform X2 [Teleopsis dalmanni]
MSCISSNFSSFFLNSLNDPSEFAKYLSNGELKFSNFEDIQVIGSQHHHQQQQHQQQQQQQLQQNGNNIAFYNNGVNSGVNNNNVNSSNSSTNSRVVVSEHSVGAVTAGGQNNTDIYNNATHMETNNYAHQTQATPAAHHSQQQQQQVAHQQHHHPASQQQHYVHGHPQQSSTANFHHNQHIAANGSVTHHNLPNTTNQAIPQGFNPAQRWANMANSNHSPAGMQQQQHNNHAITSNPQHPQHPHQTASNGAQHFDGSFEFLKYLRHSNDYSESSNDTNSTNTPANNTNPTISNQHQQQSALNNSLIDLDSSTTQKSRSSRKVAALLSSVSRASNSLDSSNTMDDVFDHDSKHTIFDLHHVTNSSNSNEMEVSNLAFPNSHLNASNSNTSSEGAAAGSNDFAIINSASNAPKPLATFAIKENFEVHPSHKIEEGIFQHMNKLPSKKKENLKQLGVRFTGQMNLYDKSIVVENFIKFCQEYDIKDHRPFLSLNQSGLNKPEQIKFARYLGQGLPTFTLFCIYSNFKNLFCTKRTEIYTKDGYNLPYILDKTKRFLANTTAGGTPNKQAQSAQSQPSQVSQTPKVPKVSQVQVPQVPHIPQGSQVQQSHVPQLPQIAQLPPQLPPQIPPQLPPQIPPQLPPQIPTQISLHPQHTPTMIMGPTI